MFLISFSIPIFHNSIPLSKMLESRINTGFWDKRIFHVLQDTLQQEYTRKGIKFFAAAIGNDKENIQRIYMDGFLDITNLEKLPVNLGKLIIQQIKNNIAA